MTATTTTARSTTATTARPGRTASIALWVLQVLLAAVFVFAAVPKLTGDPMALAGFELMGLGAAGMYVVGALEVAGAIGLLVPRLRGLASSCQILLMIGAVVSTLIFMPAAMVVLPAVVLVLVGVVAYGRRHETAALFASIRR